jgi:histidinol phosphatase-like enzyme (inositol monophosphatase family)
VKQLPKSATSSAPIEADKVRRVLERGLREAAKCTLPRFRSGLSVDNKAASGFDPVTEADREAEQAIRAVIEDAFPEHGIVGEEFERKASGSPFTWLIDPIDGTRAFISGVPVWGTLIGLLHEGRAIAGAMGQPFTGETFIATSGSGEYLREGKSVPLKANSAAGLAQARVSSTSPHMFASGKSKAAYASLEAKARVIRYGLDCYAYCMLAAGHIDVVIEEGLNPFDIVALIPIIEAAGGVVTDWRGGPAEGGGKIVAAANADIHREALALLAPGAA